MPTIQHRSGCPISYTLDFFGDKWSLLILRDMAIDGKVSYGEFLHSDEKIATNILADRLAMLEVNGFITKKVAPDKKSKYIYGLTEKSISMVPILVEIGLWGSQYNPPGLDKKLLEAIEKDKEGTIQQIQNDLRKKLQNEL